MDASSEPNRSIDFVKNVPDVDIVIDGHSHTVMTANKDNGMIQSTGTGLAYVGAFVIDNATKSVESNGLIDLSTYTKDCLLYTSTRPAPAGIDNNGQTVYN